MTAPIHNQGSEEGTCYAYAVSRRGFNRFFLRELGIALVPEVHRIILDWAKKEFGEYGGAIGITLDAMKRNAPTDLVFPEDLLRPHLNST